MKRILLLLSVFLCFTLLNAHRNSLKQSGGKLSFVQTKINCGTVYEGDVVVKDFKFKNTGNAPIIIYDVNVSCGCLTPSWHKDPIMPGEGDAIRVSFDTEGRQGPFTKTVIVLSNATNSRIVLTITGEVEVEEKK